jgi:hypothetical protein
MSTAESIALLSTLIATVALVVTVANSSVTRATLALSLFDRRMVVYEHVRKASSLAIVSEKNFVENGGLEHLHAAMNDGHFLFGPEVADFLKTLWDAAIKMQMNNVSNEGQKIDEYWNAYKDLVGGTTKFRDLLSPYMAMDHKLPSRAIRQFFG